MTLSDKINYLASLDITFTFGAVMDLPEDQRGGLETAYYYKIDASKASEHIREERLGFDVLVQGISSLKNVTNSRYTVFNDTIKTLL